MRERLIAEGVTNVFPANHGVAWSIYAHDPEGNNLEFFVDTDWHITQPFLIPLDFSKTDTEIANEKNFFASRARGISPMSTGERGSADDAVRGADCGALTAMRAPQRREHQPPETACQILVEFDGREDIDRMLASLERTLSACR